MKRTTLSLLMMLIAICGWAQTKDSIDCSVFTVGYDYKVNTTDKDDNAVTVSLQTVLLVGNKVTKTMGYCTHRCNVTDHVTKAIYDEFQRENMAHLPTIFVSVADRKIDVQEDVVPYHYTYQEKENLKWTLLDDTMTIASYPCHKAQTIYGGRIWYAYYTEDIPSTGGPWKLRGLPGLIVKAEDADCVFSFEMFELTKQNIAITQPIEAKCVKTERDKFVKMHNKLFLDKRYMENPIYYITSFDDIEYSYEYYDNNHKNPEDITHLLNGIPIPFDIKTMTHYQPLELK